MIEENVEQDNFKTGKGIGLYKIRYEMDISGSSNKTEHAYQAGVIAYTSEEAVNTLIKFGKNNVKGFKGMKIEEVSFDGGVHALSEAVRGAILTTAKKEGALMSKEDHEKALSGLNEDLKKAEKEIKKLKKAEKINIIPE